MSVATKVYQNSGNPAILQRVPASARNILDVGCGAGDNARMLLQNDRVIDGVTMSLEEAALALPIMNKVSVHNLEHGLPKELEGPYDVVIASHVLEHIFDPKVVLNDVRDKLTPSGNLIIALPNIMMFRYRWRLLLGKFDYEPGGIMDDTHVRWYTFDSAKKLLHSAGFDVIHASATGHFPFGPLRRIIPAALLSRLDTFFCSIWPGLFGSQLIYLARPSNA